MGKTYTNVEGEINVFDDENFLEIGNKDIFKYSIDQVGTSIIKLQWYFEGDYEVFDVEYDETLKTLTLSYDFMGNDYFELYVINDRTIELIPSK